MITDYFNCVCIYGYTNVFTGAFFKGQQHRLVFTNKIIIK